MQGQRSQSQHGHMWQNAYNVLCLDVADAASVKVTFGIANTASAMLMVWLPMKYVSSLIQVTTLCGGWLIALKFPLQDLSTLLKSRPFSRYSRRPDIPKSKMSCCC